MASRFRVTDVTPPSEPAPRTVPLPLAVRVHDADDAVVLHGPADVIEAPVVNALVHAVHVAFATHRPLVLAPDDVWLTILQGVAQHVARNAEKLRHRFVAHDGKAEIEIERDDLHPANHPTAGDWSTVPTELTAKVLERSSETARGLRATFTTTERASRFAMDVALLDALQSYFSYSVSSLCGIPEITLLGTPDDWDDIVRRAEALAGLGLEAWLAPLGRVLAQFARASRGDVDRAFWDAMYKPAGASGGDRVLGWLNVLFPYLREGGGTSPRNVEGHLSSVLEAPMPHELPLGLSRAPFTWRLSRLVREGSAPSSSPTRVERPMELVAGLVGATIDASTGAVRPRHGWWIAPRAPERSFLLRNPSADRTFVSPRAPDTLQSLETLARETRGLGGIDLSLGWCKQLATLDGLEQVGSLVRLGLMECHEVTTLAPVAHCSSLREVHLAQCRSLADVSALATLPALEHVATLHCPKVSDVAQIRWLADAPRLKYAALWSISNLPERFRKQLTEPSEIAALKEYLRHVAV